MFLLSGVADLCKRLISVPGDDKLSVQANANATILMKCLVRATLCSKRVTEEFRLSAEAFEWLLGEIETRFQQSHVRFLYVVQLMTVCFIYLLIISL